MKSREQQHQPQTELQPLKEPTNQTQVSEHTAAKDTISPKPKDLLTYSVTHVDVRVWAQTPIHQHQQPRNTTCDLGLGMFSAFGLFVFDVISFHLKIKDQKIGLIWDLWEMCVCEEYIFKNIRF